MTICDYDCRTSAYANFIMLLNMFVIALSTGSLLLCLRALLRAQLLKHETTIFLSRHYGWVITVGESCQFLNLWYVMICINDCLIIMGSVIKQLIESRSIVGDMWDMCSIMLGTGNMLVWFGILRYLGFFKTYNVLILTMKNASPNMIRFLVCAFFYTSALSSLDGSYLGRITSSSRQSCPRQNVFSPWSMVTTCSPPSAPSRSRSSLFGFIPG